MTTLYAADDLTEQAFERVDTQVAEQLTSRHIRTALRELNFMFSDWANRGVHSFTIDEQSVTLSVGQSTVTAAAGTVSILDPIMVRDTAFTNDLDIELVRLSRDEYQILPFKDSPSARPTQVWVDRQEPPVLYLWPIPNLATYQIRYRRAAYIGAVSGLASTPGIPVRWQDAVLQGLAARLAVIYQPQKAMLLAPLAEQAFQSANNEDRDKAPFQIQPVVRSA